MNYNVINLSVTWQKTTPKIERMLIAKCTDVEQAFLIASARTEKSASVIFTVEAES